MATKLRSRNCMVVGYARTSTDDQRLSIDGQRDTIDRIARDRDCEVAKSFTEHESGGNNERVELDKAIKHARRLGATLVVAKLDRLSRDPDFLMKLHDGNVPIVFGDLPTVDGSAASRLIIRTMANVAEFERLRMGERMKEWHRERKALGFKAGTPANLTSEAIARGQRKAAIANRARAVEEMSDISPIIAQMKAGGSTLQQIADHLNAEDYPTRNGGEWHPTQILRVLKRSKPIA